MRIRWGLYRPEWERKDLKTPDRPESRKHVAGTSPWLGDTRWQQSSTNAHRPQRTERTIVWESRLFGQKIEHSGNLRIQQLEVWNPWGSLWSMEHGIKRDFKNQGIVSLLRRLQQGLEFRKWCGQQQVQEH